ncbi:carnitine O-acetyltransferase-like isoform X1 [Vespula squamosa]|uniref:Carnitine O-acetyltransferase-like isoform X1 n=1 Tax=Vespula squamosa TaxID=30214 RepID=A0ABD2BF69_VESSQ
MSACCSIEEKKLDASLDMTGIHNQRTISDVDLLVIVNRFELEYYKIKNAENNFFFVHGRICNTISIMLRAQLTTLKLNKQELPKQPVPDLKKTAERYLRSVEPLLNENEYCNTKRIVEEFISEKGPGPLLHSKLLQIYDKTDNWLNDWWINSAYLGYRVPLIMNSNPAIVGPTLKFCRKEDMYITAAQLIKAICDYNDMLKSDKMKQEMIKNEPLDMLQYGMILGTHRRPAPKCDQLLHTDDAKHVIIMSNNNFFKLDVIKNSSILNESQIAGAIKDIVSRSQTKGKPIGILTGNDRDTWAECHCVLKEQGNNEKIIEDIEQSLFILCLDKEMPKEVFENCNNTNVRALQSLTGYNSDLNAGNRWHDKTIQYILSTDGYIGLEMEHSPCEGVPVAVLHDHVIKYITSKLNDVKCDKFDNFPRAECLKFETNDVIDCAIQNAISVVDKISQNVCMDCFTFNEFGKNEIKKCKTSPDSFIQIAMQVVYYKLHNKAPCHYESAGLRRFRKARTECIRSTSTESVSFAKAMSKDGCTDEKQLKEMMFKAINRHKDTASEASLGQGVDRHLYGLKMIATIESMDIPELYKDVAYIRSTYYDLTSSQVPFKTSSFMCYGAVVPDGYGCCYNPRDNDILFGCSTFKSCSDADVTKFANTLKETLCRMKNLCNLGVKEGFLPIYNLIYSQTDKNINLFTYEVKYKDLLSTGQAWSKKEAKQNAAQNMLTLLEKPSDISTKEPSLPLKNTNSDTLKVTSLSPILLNPTPSLEDQKNHVGSLQEYCVEHKLMQPTYEIVSITGLAHEKNFTMSCNIGPLSEEAVGTTKKRAKRQVAKKMLQRLQNTNALIINKNRCESNTNETSEECDNMSTELNNKDIFEELGLRIINLNVVNIIPQKDIEAKYFELTSKNCSRTMVSSKEDINFQNYHLFFKTYIYDNICDGKEEELIIIYDNIKKFKSNLSDVEKHDTEKIMSLEQQILIYIKEKLKLKIEKKTISCKNPLLKMIAFKISTPLPIIQFGANSNLTTAGAIALSNILDTVMIYLKKVLNVFIAKSTTQCKYTRWAHRKPIAIVNGNELFENQNDGDRKREHGEYTLKGRKQNIRVRKIESQRIVSPNEETLLDKKNDKSDTNRLNNRIIKLKENDNIIRSLMLKVKSRKKQEKNNLIFLEGCRLIRDGVEAGVKPLAILFSRSSDIMNLTLHEDVKLFQIPYKTIQLWSNLITSPGIIGIFPTPDTEKTKPAPNALPLTIICENIRDPTNLGSIIRTAAGVGCEKLILLKGCVNLWDIKVLRSAAGAHFRLPIYQLTSNELSSFISNGMNVLVTDNDVTNNTNKIFDNFNSQIKYSTSKIYENFDLQNMEFPTSDENIKESKMKNIIRTLKSQLPILPYYAIDYCTNEIALVISGETEGLSLETLKLLWQKQAIRVNIPLLNNVESLNVGVAIAVISFEIQRQIVFKQK